MAHDRHILHRITTPRGELQLQSYRTPEDPAHPVYEIIFNGIFLMASYNWRSETAQARLAVEPIESSGREISVLIGGLGIGYAVKTTLEYRHVTSVHVVEIERSVIDWAHTYFAGLNADALSDPRVHLINTDIIEYIRATTNTYDCIILDIDNGPTMTVLETNRSLYDAPMLTRMRNMLRAGGTFTVWAERECPRFMKHLKTSFDNPELITTRDVDNRGNKHDYYIYRARAG